MIGHSRINPSANDICTNNLSDIDYRPNFTICRSREQNFRSTPGGRISMETPQSGMQEYNCPQITMRVSPKPPDCPYSKEAQFPLLLSDFPIVIRLVSSYPGLRKILDTLILWPGKFLMEIRKRINPGIARLGSSHPGFPSFNNKFITQ